MLTSDLTTIYEPDISGITLFQTLGSNRLH